MKSFVADWPTQYARLAAVAYAWEGETNADWERELSQRVQELTDFQVDRIYDENGTEAFIATTRWHAAFVIRGTEDTRDVIRDVKNIVPIYQEQWDGRVGSGFWGATKRLIAPGAFDRLEWLAEQGKAISFTGHSLGGAIANAAAMKFEFDYGDKIDEHPFAIVTFGAPRVFGAGLSGILRRQVHVARFVNDRDPVPLLPGKAVGFKHLGKAGFFRRNGVYEHNMENRGYLLARINSAFKDALRFRYFRGALDCHRMQRTDGRLDYVGLCETNNDRIVKKYGFPVAGTVTEK